jgi:FkbH-like protein
MDELIARVDWQSALFADEPERAALLRLRASWPLTPRRIRFHRNHAVESALSVLRPFLEYAGVQPEILVGDYDDSLTLAAGGDADVEVIWLDYSRFGERSDPAGIADWLSGRVEALRARTPAPVLVLDWDGGESGRAEFTQRLRDRLEPLSGVRLADRSELFGALGAEYFDPERASVTGTRMSRRAAVHTARLLGTRWLPALLGPRLKAIAVDLDNTLYAGVLGEDGPAGVALTDGHLELQRELLALRDEGLFLALLSRNEPADVRELFERRTDFLLGWDDFSAHSVSWEPKSRGLEAIADALRVDPRAVLFVDDNLGELLETVQRFPGLPCLHADPEAGRTAAGMRHFPGLRGFDRSAEDALRIADLRANEERLSLAAAADDLGAYHEQLGVVLTIGHDASDNVARVAELSSKTNQFNLTLRRFSETAVDEFVTAERAQVSTARLADRLTDSGIIALAVCERRGPRLVVLELCISCRALGRQLEDLMVAQMLVSGPRFAGVEEVVFPLRDAPRNAPARTWLAQFADRQIPPAPEEVEVMIPAARVLARSVNPHVQVEVLP